MTLLNPTFIKRFFLTASSSLFFLSLVQAQQSPNLLQNGGFELPLGISSSGWSVNAQDAPKGSAFTISSAATAGKLGLRLTPNSKNPVSARTAAPFGVGQGISAVGLLGKSLYVSARMQAQGQANAIVRIYAIGNDGSAKLQELSQPPSSSGAILRRDVFQVPSNPSTFAIIVFCQVEGIAGTASFDEVAVNETVPATWNEALGTSDPGSEYSADVTVDGKNVLRHIPDTLFGSNLEWTWDGNGVWDTAHGGLNTTIVSLTKNTGLTLLRYPGASFADYYHWRDGVGPQSIRPTNNATPTGPMSTHRFGTDEALAFARQTNGSLLITVNVLTGSAAEAADWVRYVNGGGQRVLYWEVGNENYVPGPSSLSPEEYARRFVQFAEAMKAADPTIKIGAIADENFSFTASRQYPDWTDRVLKIAGREVDFLSLHCAYSPVFDQDLGWNSRTVYAAALGSSLLIGRQLDDLVRRVDLLTPGRSSPIQLAVTEWGPYFQIAPSGRFVDHSKTLASALVAASLLKTFINSPRTNVANMFKLVDSFSMGWIGLRNGVYAAKASLLALQMFRLHFGTDLVQTTTASPTFDSPAVGWTDAAGQVPFLDVVSSRSSDGKSLYIIAINKHLDRDIRTGIHIQNFLPAPNAVAYTLNGGAPDANTGTQLPVIAGVQWAKQATIGPDSRFLNGGPGEIKITTSPIGNVSQEISILFPAHSITALEFTAK